MSSTTELDSWVTKNGKSANIIEIFPSSNWSFSKTTELKSSIEIWIDDAFFLDDSEMERSATVSLRPECW